MDQKTGDSTTLAATLVGDFKITATCQDQRADWYVRFIAAQVLPTSLKTTPSGSGSLAVNCQKARIAAFATWEFEADVEFLGDTSGLKVDPAEIEVGIIQNLIDTDSCLCRARYDGEGAYAGRQLWLAEDYGPDGPPYIDSEDACFPFYQAPVSSGPVRRITFNDSPGGTFPAFVDQSGTGLGPNPTGSYFRLSAMMGELRFRTTIAVRSTHAPHSYAIVHERCWSLCIDHTLGKLEPHDQFDRYCLENPAVVKGSTPPSARNGTADRLSPVTVTPAVPSAYGIEIAGPKATAVKTKLSSKQ